MQVSNFWERSEDAVDNIQESVSYEELMEVSKRKDSEENALVEQPSQEKKPKKTEGLALWWPAGISLHIELLAHILTLNWL